MKVKLEHGRDGFIGIIPDITTYEGVKSGALDWKPYHKEKTTKYQLPARVFERLLQLDRNISEQLYIKLSCKPGDVVFVKDVPLTVSHVLIEDNNSISYGIDFDCDEFDCSTCPFYEDDVSFEGEHDCKCRGYIEFTEKDIGKNVLLVKDNLPKEEAAQECRD